jgi:hypothetical protein
MSIAVAMFADFEQTFWGTPSRLTTRLGSRSVIEHALLRLSRIDGAAQRRLVVQPRDAGAAGRTLDALNLADRIALLTIDDGQRPRRSLIRSARKWGADGWRGSLLGTTVFDEQVEPALVARVADQVACEAVLCVDGHQAGLDPQIAAAMIAQQRARADEAAFTFTQAPPGLAGIVLTRAAAADLVQRDLPVGLLLSYRPELARPDPVARAECLRVEAVVAHTAARLTCDTRRSHELLAAAFAALGEDAGAAAMCGWLAQRVDASSAALREVELELTTDDPLPATTLRPRGERVPRRRLADVSAVARLARELAGYDDRLVCLGGHGDPLVHPQAADVLRMLRNAGVLGIAVRTPLVELPPGVLAALFDARVDVLQVQLDAASAGGYRTVHRAESYDRVIGNIERVMNARRRRGSPQPIVVPSLVRCAATLPELETFFDRWITTTGAAVIEGYNQYAGRLADDDSQPGTPPVRRACRRLESRLMLLADGTAAQCSEDVSGEAPLGNWATDGIDAIWGGPRLAGLRRAHRTLELTGTRLCERCSEWARP